MKAKPCPFCGNDEVEVRVSTSDREGTPANLFCIECGANGPWIYCKNDPHTKDLSLLLEQWNTRK